MFRGKVEAHCQHHRIRDRELWMENEETQEKRKINKRLKTVRRVCSHMQVDLYLISEIILVALLSLLHPSAPREC